MYCLVPHEKPGKHLEKFQELTMIELGLILELIKGKKKKYPQKILYYSLSLSLSPSLPLSLFLRVILPQLQTFTFLGWHLNICLGKLILYSPLLSKPVAFCHTFFPHVALHSPLEKWAVVMGSQVQCNEEDGRQSKIKQTFCLHEIPFTKIIFHEKSSSERHLGPAVINTLWSCFHFWKVLGRNHCWFLLLQWVTRYLGYGS